MKDIISLHGTCDDKLIKGENPGDTYLLYVLQCHLGSFWLCFWYPEGSLDHLVALDTKEVQGPVNKHDPCKIYHLIKQGKLLSKSILICEIVSHKIN